MQKLEARSRGIILPIPAELKKVFDLTTTPNETDRLRARSVVNSIVTEYLATNKYSTDITTLHIDSTFLQDHQNKVAEDLFDEEVTDHSSEHIERLFDLGDGLSHRLASHNPLLAGYDISDIRDKLFQKKELTKSEKRLVAVKNLRHLATLFHDVGNEGGKHHHTEVGAMAAFYVLDELGFSHDVRNVVSMAIALHTKSPVSLINAGKIKERFLILEEDSILGNKGDDATEILFNVASILFLADKFDIRGGRVLPTQFDRQVASGIMAEADKYDVHHTQKLIGEGCRINVDAKGNLTVKYKVDPIWILAQLATDLAPKIASNPTAFKLYGVISTLLHDAIKSQDQTTTPISNTNILDPKLLVQSLDAIDALTVEALNKIDGSNPFDKMLIQVNPALLAKRIKGEIDLESLANYLVLLASPVTDRVYKLVEDIGAAYHLQLEQASQILGVLVGHPANLRLETNLFGEAGVIYDSARKSKQNNVVFQG